MCACMCVYVCACLSVCYRCNCWCSSLRMVYAMPVWLKYFPDRAKPKEDIGKALEVSLA